jgi:hypothetical protein
MRLRERPRTRTARVRPRCDQVFACGGVVENPDSSSKTSQAPRAAASLPRRTTPPCPTRPPRRHPAPWRVGRHLARPAVAHQKLPHALNRVARWKRRPINVLIRASVHHCPPRRARPGQVRLQLRELLLAEPRQRRRPLRPQRPRTALVPCPPPPPPPHRPDADPQILGDQRTPHPERTAPRPGSRNPSRNSGVRRSARLPVDTAPESTETQQPNPPEVMAHEHTKAHVSGCR